MLIKLRGVLMKRYYIFAFLLSSVGVWSSHGSIGAETFRFDEDLLTMHVSANAIDNASDNSEVDCAPTSPLSTNATGNATKVDGVPKSPASTNATGNARNNKERDIHKAVWPPQWAYVESEAGDDGMQENSLTSSRS